MAKLADEPQLQAFLRQEKAATFAIEIDRQGTLHIAAMLFVHIERPLAFYFVTGAESEKCRLLVRGGVQKAACVVGTVKNTPFTLQMRGTAQIVDQKDHAAAVESYIAKHTGDHGLGKNG